MWPAVTWRSGMRLLRTSISFFMLPITVASKKKLLCFWMNNLNSISSFMVQIVGQWQVNPPPGTITMQMQHLQAQGQQQQVGLERPGRRRQPSSFAGSKKGERLEQLSSVEVGQDLFSGELDMKAGLLQLVGQPVSQGHMGWHPQAPNFTGLPQAQQPPPVLQHFKQQLSSLQIPNLQQQ